jgi:hypothetical protein
MRYAFLNVENTVVQVIVGDLDETQQARFVSDYRGPFGAESVVQVDDDRSVWIGGSYDSSSGEFSPPPSSEPQPIIEEIPNDDAQII